MCGRLAITTDLRVLAGQFGVAGDVQRAAPRANIKPTESLPVAAIGSGGARRLVPMRWSLVPHFAPEMRQAGPTFNARAEGIARLPTWRPSFEARGAKGGRCLIPFDCFYEWSGPKGQRQAYTIRIRPGRRFTAFAGLWARWQPPRSNDQPSPAGMAPDAASPPPLLSCAIITVPANDAMAGLHDRMPAILDDDAWGAWLGDDAASQDSLQGLLAPYPARLTEITTGGPV